MAAVKLQQLLENGIFVFHYVMHSDWSIVYSDVGDNIIYFGDVDGDELGHQPLNLGWILGNGHFLEMYPKQSVELDGDVGLALECPYYVIVT